MCSDNCGESPGFWKNGIFTSLIDGVCEECGSDTVEGCSTDICNYSPQVCQTCGYSPCDQSC